MVTLTCSTTVADGVALVTARVEGAAVPRRVTLANRLDGPLWPPRRAGVPEAGWNDEGYVGVVPADGCLALGYASPAPPADPPLELVRSEPIEDGGRDATDEISRLDAEVAAVRGLGDPRPPRDAVPLPTPAGPSGPTEPEREDAIQSSATDRTPPDACEAPGPTSSQATPPAPIREWFEAVEERVATAERLAEADDLPAATDAVAAAGGLAGAERISEAVDDDATTLAALTQRADALAERAEAVDVPLATLRALT